MENNETKRIRRKRLENGRTGAKVGKGSLGFGGEKKKDLTNREGKALNE